MRAAIGVLGKVAGFVLLSIAFGYGYTKGEGQWFERTQLAFLYALPTAGGLFGFGLAANAWRKNALFAAALFLCAIGALGVSLSISIGAMAERTDGVEAARRQAGQSSAGLQADLVLWRQELADLVAAKIPVTDRNAETKAAEIASTARAKVRLCDEEGKACSTQRKEAETAEKESKAVSERRAATERKADLTRWIADARTKAEAGGPVRRVDAQADMLASMFGVAPDTASLWVRLGLLVIAEVIVALMNAYAEVMKEDICGQMSGLVLSASAPVLADKPVTEASAPVSPPAAKPAAKKRTEKRTSEADGNVVQLRRPLTLQAVLAMRASGQKQKEVAAYFGVSTRTIRRMEAAGQADRKTVSACHKKRPATRACG